eukprot:1383592-Heterocapsa_arctica.AAC.1
MIALIVRRPFANFAASFEEVSTLTLKPPAAAAADEAIQEEHFPRIALIAKRPFRNLRGELRG